jgi:excinuclease ABC subunit C
VLNTPKSDDYAALEYVVGNHYSKYPQPDLIIIDGGKGHLTKIVKILKNFKNNIHLIGIAKGDGRKPENDKIYVFDKGEIKKMSCSQELFKFIQIIRDEAHNYAINFQRRLSRKKITHSILDEIPDISKKRKSALLKHFKSIDAIKNATIDDLTTIQGIGLNIANKIYNFFHP